MPFVLKRKPPCEIWVPVPGKYTDFDYIFCFKMPPWSSQITSWAHSKWHLLIFFTEMKHTDFQMSITGGMGGKCISSDLHGTVFFPLLSCNNFFPHPWKHPHSETDSCLHERLTLLAAKGDNSTLIQLFFGFSWCSSHWIFPLVPRTKISSTGKTWLIFQMSFCRML